MWDLKQNKSICIYPFVHKHIDTDQIEKLCCFGNTSLGPSNQNNTKNRQTIIDNMLDGKAINGCESCYARENKGAISKRVEETTKWIKKHGIPSTIDIKWLDLRNDKTCNLKCKTCGPEASTLWEKELRITPQKKLPLDITDSQIKSCIKFYQAGGEPFLNQYFYELLEKMSSFNPDCEITINTNAYNIPQKWLNVFEKLTNLTIVVSIDCIGDLLTYVRYPIKQKQIQTTIDNLKNINHINIFINSVLSNLTMHTLIDLYGFIKNNITRIGHFELVILHKPQEFTIQAIPYNARKKYVEQVSQVINLIDNDIKSTSKIRHKELDKKFNIPQALYSFINLKNLKNELLEKNYDHALHKKLQNTLIKQDSTRSLQLKDVDQFLYTWIFNK